MKEKAKLSKQDKERRQFIKRLVGRPTKYKKKFAQMLVDYFNVEPTVINADGKLEAVRFPTLERFAVNIGVYTETLLDWANAKNKDESPKYPEFTRSYALAKQMQKDILVINAMTGRYVSNFATFVATNYTDMVDKKEIDATSKGERIIGFNYIVPEKPEDDTENPNTDN